MSTLTVQTRIARTTLSFRLALVVTALTASNAARPAVHGINGPAFSLTAGADYVSTPDGASIYSWGYGAGGSMQLPGPTLIVSAGDTVTVTLTNRLPGAAGPVSILFPGHQVTATGGISGLITREAPTGGSVSYVFVASRPGTYLYHSGTRPDLQVAMGLYGALIVRPANPALASCAYDHPASCFDREVLFLLSELDLDIHRAVEAQAAGAGPIAVATEPFRPEYWLINGRAAPDTMATLNSELLPHQPYNCVPRMLPGERLLLRVIGAGRQMHPFHTHGNHVRVLARDGNLLLSTTDSTKLAGPLLFTIPSLPGGTVDAVFEWTGKDLGWDIYGHTAANDPLCEDTDGDGYDDTDSGGNRSEWCADHTKPIPVQLPELNVLSVGGMYSGSPYLGVLGSLPPGQGGLNPNAGFTHMWHSHAEKEIVNNDIFPGGMMTMLIIEPPGTMIEELE